MSGRKEHILALIAFALVTIAMLYPVSLHPATMVVGRPFEDAFEYVWYLDWYKTALFDLQVSPLFQPHIFYPTGWNLGFSAFPPLYPALLAPLTALAGAVLAYNLTVMASCLIAALGSYWLARLLGANVWGGLLAGIAFAFYPHREIYLAGHLNFLMGSMWLPWVLAFLLRAYQNPARRTRWTALAGLAFALTIAGSWHFVFIGSAAVAIFGLFLIWSGNREAWRRWLRPLAAAALTMLLTIGPFLLNAALVHSQLQETLHFSFQDTAATGVHLERFLVPSAINPLFWELARTTIPLRNGIDGVVNFGYVVMLLGAVALWRARPWFRPLLALVAVIVAGLVMMPGLILFVNGAPVTSNAAPLRFLGNLIPQLIQPDGSVAVPLPGLLPYLLLPPFRTFHAFGRWGLIVALALAPLAGLGLTLLQKRFSAPAARTAIAAMALLLLLVEFNLQPLPDVTRIPDMQRQVDRWLAAQPETNTIIEYPLEHTMKGQSLYYSTIHRQKMVHGAGSIFPGPYLERLPTLRDWPSPATLDLLQELEVRYILLNIYDSNGRFETETLPQLEAIERLQLVRHFDDDAGPIRDIYLFELQPQAPSSELQ
jgi:hypothetical protein